MKKISSKKLQLRSSIIAVLAGRDLGIVQGGTGIDIGGGGGNASEGAGVRSHMDGTTTPRNCDYPITTC